MTGREAAPRSEVAALSRAFGLSTAASFASIAFGVGTNKIIATVSGTEGIALVSIFRSLSAVFVALAPLGAADAISVRLSTAPEQRRATIVAAFKLYGFLAAALILLALAFAAPIAAWLVPGRDLTTEVRIVIALTTGTIGLQLAIAALSGLMRVREVALANLATALCTLLVAYPLANAGSIGIAALLGSTGFVGAGIGGALLIRELRRYPRAAAPTATSLFSPWLLAQPAVATTTALIFQWLLASSFSLEEVGYFGAALTIESSAMLLLTAGMRPYYLPRLAQLESHESKSRLANVTITMLLAPLLLGTLTLVLWGRPLLEILFAKDFAAATPLLLPSAAGMFGQTIAWCSALYLIHKSDFGAYAVCDAIWKSVQLIAIVIATHRGVTIESIMWIHAASCLLAASVFDIAVWKRHGPLTRVRTVLLAAMALTLVLVVAQLSSRAAV